MRCRPGVAWGLRNLSAPRAVQQGGAPGQLENPAPQQLGKQKHPGRQAGKECERAGAAPCEGRKRGEGGGGGRPGSSLAGHILQHSARSGAVHAQILECLLHRPPVLKAKAVDACRRGGGGGLGTLKKSGHGVSGASTWRPSGAPPPRRHMPTPHIYAAAPRMGRRDPSCAAPNPPARPCSYAQFSAAARHPQRD